MERARMRFWVELAFAGLAGVLGIVTLITREWIEAITGFDPDGGSGSLEWGLVIVLLLGALVAAILARSEWRRAAGSTQPEGARG